MSLNVVWRCSRYVCWVIVGARSWWVRALELREAPRGRNPQVFDFFLRFLEENLLLVWRSVKLDPEEEEAESVAPSLLSSCSDSRSGELRPEAAARIPKLEDERLLRLITSRRLKSWEFLCLTSFG